MISWRISMFWKFESKYYTSPPLPARWLSLPHHEQRPPPPPPASSPLLGSRPPPATLQPLLLLRLTLSVLYLMLMVFWERWELRMKIPYYPLLCASTLVAWHFGCKMGRLASARKASWRIWSSFHVSLVNWPNRLLATSCFLFTAFR